MDMLKKLFPHAFASTEQNKLVTALIVYIVVAGVGFVAGALIGGLCGILLGWIKLVADLVGLILSIVGYIVGAYAFVGIVLTLLVYFKVIK